MAWHQGSCTASDCTTVAALYCLCCSVQRRNHRVTSCSCVFRFSCLATYSTSSHVLTHFLTCCFAVREGINNKLQQVSPLGDYNSLLTALHRLTSMKPVIRALTQTPFWLGMQHTLGENPDNGRQVLLTLLGPAFALTVLPDPQLPPQSQPQPSIGEQCFSDYQNRRPGDLIASMQTLKMTTSSIVDSLHNISMNFLRNQVSPFSKDFPFILMRSDMWCFDHKLKFLIKVFGRLSTWCSAKAV